TSIPMWAGLPSPLVTRWNRGRASPQSTRPSGAWVARRKRHSPPFGPAARSARPVRRSLVASIPLDPDIRSAVPAGVTHLVRARRTSSLLAEVDEEPLVELHAAVARVAIDLQQVRSLFRQVGIELVVPAAVERVGDVESLAVQAELQHLRPASQLAAVRL